MKPHPPHRIEVTEAVCPDKIRIVCCVFVSQILIVESFPALANNLDSGSSCKGAQAKALIHCLCPTSFRPICSPVHGFQIKI